MTYIKQKHTCVKQADSLQLRARINFTPTRELSLTFLLSSNFAPNWQSRAVKGHD